VRWVTWSPYEPASVCSTLRLVAADSYSLKEVAERLGVSKRTLQRRIREGAFPRRFLAPGRHGLETRIPAADVRTALDAGHEPLSAQLVPKSALALAGSASALSPADLESVREAALSIARHERETLLLLFRESLDAQAQESAQLRDQLAMVTRSVDRLRQRVEESLETRPQDGAPASSDSGARLLGEIEALLARLPRP